VGQGLAPCTLGGARGRSHFADSMIVILTMGVVGLPSFMREKEYTVAVDLTGCSGRT
jgi:hypothetical protein